MPRRYARTYRRSSAWDARADAKRAAAEAAGIPVRDDADCRAPITLDLSCVGGDCLMLEPCRGKVAWRERLQDVAHNGALGAVFPNRQGNPYTDGGFAAMWGKLMREAVAAGVAVDVDGRCPLHGYPFGAGRRDSSPITTSFALLLRLDPIQ